MLVFSLIKIIIIQKKYCITSSIPQWDMFITFQFCLTSTQFRAFKSYSEGVSSVLKSWWTFLCNLFHSRLFPLLPKKCHFKTRVLKFWEFYFQIPPDFKELLISLSPSLQYNTITLKYQ